MAPLIRNCMICCRDTALACGNLGLTMMIDKYKVYRQEAHWVRLAYMKNIEAFGIRMWMDAAYV